MPQTFESIMAERTAPACAICSHPERDAIESARNKGRSYVTIGRVLTQMGAFGDGITERSAARRVRIHFRDHA